jgi:hypothetical protein
MAEEQKRTAAYVPWATFKNSLEQLAKGMPSRIDRSVFPGIAWNAQNQLFIAFKFMGLLKGEEEPTPLLDELVKGNEEERKAKLAKVVRDSYAELIAIDLTKASKAHFEEKLGELYNVSGDTKVKAVRFFVSAAQYLGISLSAFILPKDGKTKRTRRPGTATPRTAPKKGVTVKTESQTKETHDISQHPGESRSVSLLSGGTLTVSASAKFLSLSSADRTFVFELIDKLEEYAKKIPS